MDSMTRLFLGNFPKRFFTREKKKQSVVMELVGIGSKFVLRAKSYAARCFKLRFFSHFYVCVFFAFNK